MPLLSVVDLHTHYAAPGGTLRAVDGVSLSVERGETVGLVGESGCGKSTLGKTIMRLTDATSGSIVFDGEDISGLSQRSLQPVRRRLQMIFQDPFASLNPRQTIRNILTAPLSVHKVGNATERARRVEAIMDSVGLPRSALLRYPHEFSGGQRQRIGIARALILEPRLVVCDEPVSALDLSLQAQVLNLLGALRKSMELSYLFISHDLSVVRYFADRILVMYLGRIVETADSRTLWSSPKHPYTHALVDAMPDPTRFRRATPLPEDLSSSLNPASGCRFRPRCAVATAKCAAEAPPLRQINAHHWVACHHPVP